MDKLNECIRLMQRICDLPQKEEEFKKHGFSNKELNDYRQMYLSLEPEVNIILNRMKEIIDYIEGRNHK